MISPTFVFETNYLISMSSDTKIVVAFDLYGTLLSTGSIADELSKHFGKEKAESLAELWRRYQLEYTWRLNSMSAILIPVDDLNCPNSSQDQYQLFSTITRNSLGHALQDFKLKLDDAAVDSLMKAYDSLSTFPDVAPALKTLSEQSNITAVVFSNGTDSMVDASVTSSPDLGPYASIFRQIITVEEIKKFKPCPEVYYHLADKVGKGKSAKELGEMWLVSANPFDIVGARAMGMKAAWVDRGGNGWSDKLVQGPVGTPTVVMKDLGEVADVVIKHAGGQ